MWQLPRTRSKGNTHLPLCALCCAFYKHENLLLEIHTSSHSCDHMSVGVGQRRKVVIFTAEQELDGLNGASHKTSRLFEM